MKVTIAIDSFKGCLSSCEAGHAAEDGIRRVYPDAESRIFSIADGGEGTVAALSEALGAKTVELTTNDPLSRPIKSTYGYVESTKTALIEMASTAGLPLLKEEERNPLYTTTYGVGEIILDALDRGAEHFIVGIGGSATNDGGAGMLLALGYGLYDELGNKIPLGAIGLSLLASIDTSTADKRLSTCDFTVLCDVKNPLLGKDGASFVYGGQKGADDEMKSVLDTYLARFAMITRSVIPDANDMKEGSGAAGGLGYSLMAYLGAELLPGIDAVLRLLGVESAIAESNIVLTGEGRLDSQSFMGKAPVGVAMLAKAHGKPCYALAGALSEGVEALSEYGITASFAITPSDMPLEVAMMPDVAKDNMRKTAERLASALKSTID